MSGIAIAVIMAVLAGVGVSLQAPLSSILNQRIGQIESVFIVHLGGTVVAGNHLVVRRRWEHAGLAQCALVYLAGGCVGADRDRFAECCYFPLGVGCHYRSHGHR